MKLGARLFFFLFFIFSPSLFSADCVQKRMGVDIGSGSTKFKLALVDTCHLKIEKILFEKSLPLFFKENLAKNAKHELGPEIIEEAKNLFEKIKEETNEHGPFQIYAVATAAFREAKNGKKAAEKLSKYLGAKITILSQKVEGLLGFKGATTILNSPQDQIMVWDIGGSSQQITVLKNGKPLIYEGKLASVSFKNKIITKIQKKEIEKIRTPNPINMYQAAMAISLAKKEIEKIPKFIREEIKNKKLKLVGIGGVHNNSIKDQLKLKENFYNIEMLEKGIKERLGMTDEQIGGDYASTDISNLLMVYSMMNEMRAERVDIVKITLAEALLLHPEVISKKINF